MAPRISARKKPRKRKRAVASAYFVYLLRCEDETIYTGMTNNIENRLKRHKSGAGAKYTRMRGAVEMLYTEEHATIGAALKREAAIKKWPRIKKLALVQARRAEAV